MFIKIGEILTIIANNNREEYTINEILKVVKLALSCTNAEMFDEYEYKM